jgi:hypothetical protein
MIPAINGERLVVGPYTPRQQIEHVIEPVRIAGWRGGRNNPILHAKILVMGRIELPRTVLDRRGWPGADRGTGS